MCVSNVIFSGLIQKTRHKNQALLKDFPALKYFFQDHSILPVVILTHHCKTRNVARYTVKFEKKVPLKSFQNSIRNDYLLKTDQRSTVFQ